MKTFLRYKEEWDNRAKLSAPYIFDRLPTGVTYEMLPKASDYFGLLSEKEAEELFSYMVQDKFLSLIPMWDDFALLEPGKPEKIPAYAYSDGMYFWYYRHAYFVKTYRMMMPETFMEHYRKNRNHNSDFTTKGNLELNEKKKAMYKQLNEGDLSFYEMYEEVNPTLLT
ncbi:hypothetical protein [Profundibacter amoris]|uniref:Uncharacterized protein n=1 Tax=Profundibacter amoris TaxID=2171755 RepID=A0A347UHP8_9RHOB|nr:hypothetical protein [Profundibacter amoris]AXX98376.1 hypothetical protein BAR1_10830 [Profundibacter amoris]